ncbi:LamB/YcsF family protein [Quadrisphaera oryzae]|uniref:LamB/YcsF family protein n=1 Tax=Quadrisphaera TaxID=317661 RepID=UPI001644B203|nr:LamB/YcsF family protein [Quadrisphaera sp. RL12-1S]
MAPSGGGGGGGVAPPARVDLNADLGEGFGRWSLTDDDALLDVVTSANVACGFHAGDPETVLAVCGSAARRGVAVGAHPSYRDLVGFGRRYVDASRTELVADVLYQLGALAGLARAAGTRVSYVKPHGALYTTAAGAGVHGEAVVEAVRRFDPELPLVALAGSPLLDLARAAGLRTVAEAFADRGYTATGALVDRRSPGALVTDPSEVAARVVRLVTEGVVRSVDGADVPVRAESVCVHGDSPGAVAVARAVRSALEAAGVQVRAASS